MPVSLFRRQILAASLTNVPPIVGMSLERQSFKLKRKCSVCSGVHISHVSASEGTHLYHTALYVGEEDPGECDSENEVPVRNVDQADLSITISLVLGPKYTQPFSQNQELHPCLHTISYLQMGGPGHVAHEEFQMITLFS